MEEQQMQSDVLQKETFYGIKQLLDKAGVNTRERPILFIIKNIKAFPPQVLNDFIHHLKIYRSAPHNLNLNLMLGCQNNNKDDIHLRVSIQNCLKLVIKMFYFPSMKNVIFEVMHHILMSPNTLISFDAKVI